MEERQVEVIKKVEGHVILLLKMEIHARNRLLLHKDILRFRLENRN